MDILSEHNLLYYSQLPNSIEIYEDILSFFIHDGNNISERLPHYIINIRNANANGISSNYPSAMSGHGENWRQSVDSRGSSVTSKAVIGTPQFISLNEPACRCSREEVHQLITQSENTIKRIKKHKETTKKKIAELEETVREKKIMFAAFKLKHADDLKFQKYQRLFISKKAKREHILKFENKLKIERQHHSNAVNEIKTQIAKLADTRNRLYQQLTAARQEKMHIDHRLVGLIKNKKNIAIER